MSIQALVLDVDGVMIQPPRFAEYLQREHPSIAQQTHEFFQLFIETALLAVQTYDKYFQST